MHFWETMNFQNLAFPSREFQDLAPAIDWILKSTLLAKHQIFNLASDQDLVSVKHQIFSSAPVIQFSMAFSKSWIFETWLLSKIEFPRNGFVWPLPSMNVKFWPSNNYGLALTQTLKFTTWPLSSWNKTFKMLDADFSSHATCIQHTKIWKSEINFQYNCRMREGCTMKVLC